MKENLNKKHKLENIFYHKEILESGRWFEFSIYDQLANIWSEVWRSLNNLAKWDKKRFEWSIARAYELLDMSLADPKWKNTPELKEIQRIHELVSDYFHWENHHKSTPEFFEKYFLEKALISIEERKKKRSFLKH